jgi:hypothetical protein
MITFKHRKTLFWLLMALLASTSMVGYAQSEANFFVKTLGVVSFQQLVGGLIYFLCFGRDLLKPRTRA